MKQSTRTPRRTASARDHRDSGSATRSALIESARESFGRSGFDGTSVREITEGAEANLGAVTYHFGSKRALYEAVLEGGLRPLAEAVQAAAEEDGSALDRILGVVEAYFDHLGDQPDLPHLLLQEIAAGKDPPDVVLEIIGNLKDTISGLLAEGVRDGSVRPGHPALTAVSVAALPIHLTLIAPMLRRVAGVDTRDPATRGQVVTHVSDFVARALRPTSEASP